MKLKPYTFNLSIAFSLAALGCAGANGNQAPVTPEMPAVNESSSKTDVDNRIAATGTVRYLNISGGFWGIVGDDGKNYDPLGLDPAFQQDGLRVHFEAVPETELMSTHMWGTLITLVHIEPLNDG